MSERFETSRQIAENVMPQKELIQNFSDEELTDAIEAAREEIMSREQFLYYENLLVEDYWRQRGA